MTNAKGALAPVSRGCEVNLGPLKDHLAFHLRLAQDASFQAFSRRVGQADLCPGHFTILSVICENPGLNQTVLSHATGRDKSTLTPALKELEKRGFIMRTRSEADRRAYHVMLTDEGEAHLEQLRYHARAHGRALDELVGDFNKPLLIHLLERIAEGLRSDVSEPA